METFGQYICEKYINVFDPEDKQAYADEVWRLLQYSYDRLGGLKGSGFENKQRMIEAIPMWKIFKSGGRIRGVVMYKDKFGRKVVAVASDRSQPGIAFIKQSLAEDLKRSYIEASGPLLTFMKKHFPDLVDRYKLPVETVMDLLRDPSIQPIDQYSYKRDIGGEEIEKMALGTPNKRII